MFGLDDILEGVFDAMETIAKTTAGAIETVADITEKTAAAGIDAVDDVINS